MDGTDVIVGIDGTPASDAAVRWAAAEAARTGARLRIVLVARHTGTQTQTHAQVAAAIGEASRPGLEVTGHVVTGDDPADVLTSLAADAALTVVGSHGHTALTEALRGATGTRVAMRAPGCTVLVRGRTDATDGPVVVGVDGSPTDHRLLAVAFEHAARRGCDVVALRALPPPAAAWGVGIPSLTGNPVQLRATLLTELTADLQRRHEQYPTVRATARMPGGDPASALLDASGKAQLLVLGGRPHGPAAALLAGSVSQRLLYHADCPLLIVHSGRQA
jgi:nucleotide-binding universal stress UspA family protein